MWIFDVEEDLVRGFVSEDLSGPGVEFILDPLDIGMRQHREVRAFLEVLSDEAVGMFVEAALPSVVGLGKEAQRTERAGDLGVYGELFSVV
jgi:hypothetical protein